MSSLSGIPDEKLKWIMQDGNLDARRIESINSVIGGNRMLTPALDDKIS